MSDGSSEPTAKWWHRWWPSWQRTILGVALWAMAYKTPQWLAVDLAPFVARFMPYSFNERLFVLYMALELLTVGLVVLALRLLNLSIKAIGVDGFKQRYIVLSLGGYASYFVVVAVVFVVAASLGLNMQEDQPLGFANPSTYEKVLIFVALGLVVPFAEELLFRGFLFTVVRERLSFVLTSLLVSIVFALVHGQLLVGIDVFILSVVACYLREKTGSIWPGFIVHSLKNSVAFLLLFIYNVR